jgi:hypothetical protein
MDKDVILENNENIQLGKISLDTEIVRHNDTKSIILFPHEDFIYKLTFDSTEKRENVFKDLNILCSVYVMCPKQENLVKFVNMTSLTD